MAPPYQEDLNLNVLVCTGAFVLRNGAFREIDVLGTLTLDLELSPDLYLMKNQRNGQLNLQQVEGVEGKVLLIYQRRMMKSGLIK